MILGRSILAQVAGLALAAIVAVLAISFAVIFSTPAPDLPRMTAAEAGLELRGGDVPHLERRIVRQPSGASVSHLIGRAVADMLGVPDDRVRAVWLESPATTGSDRRQSVVVIAGQEAVVEARSGGFLLRSGTAARLPPDLAVPPFRVALRQADGRWLEVSPRTPLLTPWRLRLILAFLLSALLVAPLAWFMARRLTRPIRGLAHAADRVRLSPGGEEVPIEGPREIRAAAAAINAMRARLVRELSETTRMLAAVAHDLRNPLTSVRVRAETVPEPERSRIIADLDRMSGMIAQVLGYAKGREVHEEAARADLVALVRNCREEARLRNASVVLGDLPDRLVVVAAAETLRRAMLNLVDNAIRYAGNARLSLESRAEWVFLIVEDEGPGIAEDELQRLLEPFERAERSRSGDTGGVGLGLAIARDAARRHGGDLVLCNRPSGGLRAAIRLPVAPGRHLGRSPTGG